MPGRVTIEAIAVDREGNRSAPVTTSFTVLNVPPRLGYFDLYAPNPQPYWRGS